MIYQVINSDICVRSVSIDALSSSASLFIGDTTTVTLLSSYETPPESMILGAIPVDTALTPP
ncbi:hypothetical protein BAG01nite_03440 [Brevibacillus agri]|uniref:Spore gernimation protein n=1 Tax=Brevibacillus agri TaxID=51101 RepID=A0A3M8AYK6_9BACL|nr:spore gernimation protein [Brevibacillus agri]QAV13428.1 spore gernimation protein [Brevibacillus agri]RNB56269.1 spore gernimation protein [Brevibacillus agri]GED24242.1 hypothetical protein BAG01nite_03440 [Brevibacillus agri]